MIYQGSKARIVGDILPIMLKDMHPGMAFVDGFCGGCSVIQNVPPEYRRIANDNNRYLIAMWSKLTTTDWKPPTKIEKPFYVKVRESWHKNDGAFDDATIGWVGFMASWNGRFFDGAESNMDLYLLMETPATTAFEEELSTMIDYSRNHAKADTDVVDIFKDRIFEAARLEVIKGLPHWEKCAEHPGKPGIFSVHVGFIEMGGYEINMGDVFDRLPKI